jgi:hypothetical protein
MRLDSVRIQNFRSIESIELTLEPSCRILVGINESGKTNILRALSLLDKDTEPDDDDIREFLPGEDPEALSKVNFVFTLDKDERIQIYEKLAEKIFAKDLSGPIVSLGGKHLTLAQFVDATTEIVYVVNIRDKNKYLARWTLPTDTKIFVNWKKPVKKTPPVTIDVEGDTVKPSDYLIINTSGFAEEAFSSHVTALTRIGLTQAYSAAAKEVLENELPRCVFWQYSEENLLPGQVDINTFANNPNSCTPLKHMFALAGHKNIKDDITVAQSRPNGMRNLLKRVAEVSTRHMHKVWKDYKGIKLQLLPNGDKIDANIEDTYNLYDLSRRSDGFKRFITFLLLISATVKTKQLQNTLYLQDEPDLSLHPSGARYLRDELIKISESNYVVYSTHSIFMVDRTRIDRHLIVEKKKEVTTVKEANASNITDEEVIYNALGYSIFENLKAKNIVFEGWRDKRLFQTAMTRIPKDSAATKDSLNDVGLCHAKGVKDITRITPILELANRDWVIVSDADKVAIEQQKLYNGDGPWFRYDDLLKDRRIITAEDFIIPDSFQPIIKRLRSENPSLPDLPISNLGIDGGRLDVLRKWLEQNGIDKDKIKPMLNNIKTELFDNLKPSQIEPDYYDLLNELEKKLSHL